MEERDFQQKARKYLDQGSSILIVAPTGLGKTRAAIAPFVNNIYNDGLLGTRLIYTLPLRALSKGVFKEFEDISKGKWMIIHHGEEPESEIFSERAVVTTIDQYFTAFAGAPLSWASHKSHAAAGAILTSYSIFDEVHLLSPRYGLPLLFAILKLRQRWGLLSCVMTATMPRSVIDFLCLHCELKVVEASSNDVNERDSWRKVKLTPIGKRISKAKWEWDEYDIEKTVTLVKERWNNWDSSTFGNLRKIIVFVNTVERAIQIYEGLKEGLADKILLAHSRFTKDDRQKIENELNKRFGREDNLEGVLITTQVAEAGLNISAPLVITELCPMDSLIQRGGRCNRFKLKGKEGEVIVIKPVLKDRRWYLPYEKEVCEQTESLLQNKFTDGIILDWKTEKELLDEALGKSFERYLKETLEEGGRVAQRTAITVSEAISILERAFATRNPNEIEQGLREILNVQVAVIEDRESAEKELAKGRKLKTIAVPFWLFRGKVMMLLKERNEGEDPGVYRLEANRILDRGESVKVLSPIYSADFVLPGQTFALTSHLAGYTPEKGLTFKGAGYSPGFETLPEEEKKEKFTGGRFQTWKEHTEGVWKRSERLSKLYRPFIKSWAKGVFHQKQDAQEIEDNVDSILWALRVAVLFHDLGKLNKEWQEIAWEWEEKIRNSKIDRAKEGMFIARMSPLQDESILKELKRLPSHAPFAYPFLQTFLRSLLGNYRFLDALSLAAARHHSLEVSGKIRKDEFDLEIGAIGSLQGFLFQLLGINVEEQQYLLDALNRGFNSVRAGCEADEPPSPSDDFYFLYCLINRMVKLCDWEDAGNKLIELPDLKGHEDAAS